MSTKIYVATHIETKVPDEDLYIPIQNGRKVRKKVEGCIGDDTGDNISDKFRYYSELTSIYWIWKNTNWDYVGFCHYRRYFYKKNGGEIIDKEFLNNALNENDMIVYEGYTIESTAEYFFKYHYNFYQNFSANPLEYARDVIEKIYPEYLKSFDYNMSVNKFYFCNMIVTSKKLYDGYCEWLFNILFELENYFYEVGYNYEPRLLGYIAERLFRVWLTNQNIKILELPVETSKRSKTFN